MEDLYYCQSKFISCQYSEQLLNKIILLNQKTSKKVNINQIKKAIYFCKKYHGDQRRISGEPYYSHPIAVAVMVAGVRFETDLLITAILHDTIEDTSLSKEKIQYIFNSNIAENVDLLTRDRGNKKISSAELVESLWIQKNKALLLVKLFDRVHNMQTIRAKPKEKIKKTVSETLISFLPITIDLAYSEIEKEFDALCSSTIEHKSIEQSIPQILDFAFEHYSLIAAVFLNSQNVAQPTGTQPLLE